MPSLSKLPFTEHRLPPHPYPFQLAHQSQPAPPADFTTGSFEDLSITSPSDPSYERNRTRYLARDAWVPSHVAAKTKTIVQDMMAGKISEGVKWLRDKSGKEPLAPVDEAWVEDDMVEDSTTNTRTAGLTGTIGRKVKNELPISDTKYDEERKERADAQFYKTAQRCGYFPNVKRRKINQTTRTDLEQHQLEIEGETASPLKEKERRARSLEEEQNERAHLESNDHFQANLNAQTAARATRIKITIRNRRDSESKRGRARERKITTHTPPSRLPLSNLSEESDDSDSSSHYPLSEHSDDAPAIEPRGRWKGPPYPESDAEETDHDSDTDYDASGGVPWPLSDSLKQEFAKKKEARRLERLFKAVTTNLTTKGAEACVQRLKGSKGDTQKIEEQKGEHEPVTKTPDQEEEGKISESESTFTECAIEAARKEAVEYLAQLEAAEQRRQQAPTNAYFPLAFSQTQQRPFVDFLPDEPLPPMPPTILFDREGVDEKWFRKANKALVIPWKTERDKAIRAVLDEMGDLRIPSRPAKVLENALLWSHGCEMSKKVKGEKMNNEDEEKTGTQEAVPTPQSLNIDNVAEAVQVLELRENASRDSLGEYMPSRSSRMPGAWDF